MDLQQLYNKLERIDEKLDSHLERIAVVEERQKGQQGQIRLMLGLLMSAITGIVGYAIKQITTRGGIH